MSHEIQASLLPIVHPHMHKVCGPLECGAVIYLYESLSQNNTFWIQCDFPACFLPWRTYCSCLFHLCSLIRSLFLFSCKPLVCCCSYYFNFYICSNSCPFLSNKPLKYATLRTIYFLISLYSAILIEFFHSSELPNPQIKLPPTFFHCLFSVREYKLNVSRDS